MTPKTKAKTIINNFYNLRGMDWDMATNCAMIAVDEIIKSGPSFPYDIQFDSMPHFRSLKYWQEVKSEIEKL